MMAMAGNPVKPCQRAADQVGVRVAVRTDIFTHAFLACLICLGLAGCASPSAVSNAQATVPAFRDTAMSIQSANAAIAIGTSTRSEVLAALGPATVVKFDSGYEVWAYRDKSPDTATKPAELVILFAPSGIVKKTRIKPPS